jgi:rhomboid domain-containing protein 1
MWRSSDVCLSADRIINGRNYRSLIYSQLLHSYDMHLYYNMLAFLGTGIYLEKRFGSLKFFIILATFTLSTGLTYVGLQFLLANLYEDRDHMYSCAVGFSGVIFALKVLSTHLSLEYERNRIYYFGVFQFKEKYLVWVELVLISVVLPNTSFVGHVSGIFVGYSYTQGPLKKIVNSIHGMVLK